MEVGIDIEEIERIKSAHKRWGKRFLSRIFTKRELDYCFSKRNPYPCLAGRFCSKEAVIKVFDGKIGFLDIEIVNEGSGRPCVYVKGKLSNVKISISHSRLYATAIALKDE